MDLPVVSPPAYSPIDPNPQQQTYSELVQANAMLAIIAHLPFESKKSVFERAIRIYNASVPTPADQILLAKPAGFSELYPKLDQLIKKLEFISNSSVGCFAFACGLYSEYCEIKTTAETAQRKTAFFQKYFEIEGSDAGIAKLQRFKSCEILFLPDQEKLNTVLENIDVECLPATPVESVNPNFDYPLVLKTVVNQIGGFQISFYGRLGFSSYQIESLRGVVGKSESRSDHLIMLHTFAKQGHGTDELLEPLGLCSRNDLKLSLKKALDTRSVQVPVQCTDSASKKSKGW